MYIALQDVAYVMRLSSIFRELSNVLESSNLPAHLPAASAGPLGARLCSARRPSVAPSSCFQDLILRVRVVLYHYTL